jgi:hypothetical protein
LTERPGHADLAEIQAVLWQDHPALDLRWLISSGFFVAIALG